MSRGFFNELEPRKRKPKTEFVQCSGVRGRVCLGRVRSNSKSRHCPECASIAYRDKKREEKGS